jgi:hypothetical protein
LLGPAVVLAAVVGYAALWLTERPAILFDEASARVWLPFHADGSPADDGAVATREGPAAVAPGEPADRIDGFRRTHRQALLTQMVALAAGLAGPARHRLRRHGDLSR